MPEDKVQTCWDCDAPLPAETDCRVCDALGLRMCGKCGTVSEVDTGVCG